MVRQVREARRTNHVKSGVRLGKALFLLVVLAASVAAQDPAQARLTALHDTAQKQTAAWQTLAKSLELRIARMLPCDARVRAAIEEVGKASEARMDALTAYLQSAAAGARQDTGAVSAGLNAEQAAAHEMETEAAEAEQELIAIGGQLADLTISVKSKPGLEDARQKLDAIAALVRERGADAHAQSVRRVALIAALKDLLAADQAKQKAVENELGAVVTETARWSDYYAARVARAQTECSITNQTPASQRKKR